MKKGLIRLFFTTTIIIACIFVSVLLVTMFGGIQQADFDNDLVKWLFIILGAFFIVLSVVSLTLIFINEELVKEVVLRSDKDGTTRTTVGTIKAIAKKTTLLLPGVRCTACNIVDNEFGIRLKITLKVKNKNVDDVDNVLRAMLEDAFYGALSFRFYSIEMKIKKMKPSYTVNAEEIIHKVEEQQENIANANREENDNDSISTLEEPKETLTEQDVSDASQNAHNKPDSDTESDKSDAYISDNKNDETTEEGMENASEEIKEEAEEKVSDEAEVKNENAEEVVANETDAVDSTGERVNL